MTLLVAVPSPEPNAKGTARVNCTLRPSNALPPVAARAAAHGQVSAIHPRQTSVASIGRIHSMPRKESARQAGALLFFGVV